jgi:hypothetical protein
MVSVKPLSYIDFSINYAITVTGIKSTFDPKSLKPLQVKAFVILRNLEFGCK